MLRNSKANAAIAQTHKKAAQYMTVNIPGHFEQPFLPLCRPFYKAFECSHFPLFYQYSDKKYSRNGIHTLYIMF